jgi:hypothetical protein
MNSGRERICAGLSIPLERLAKGNNIGSEKEPAKIVKRPAPSGLLT